MRQKELHINPEFLKPELYSFQIPPHILKGLGLLAPGEKKRRGNSRASKRTSVGSARSRQGNTSANSTLGQNIPNPAYEAYHTGQINLVDNQSHYTGKRIQVKKSQHQVDAAGGLQYSEMSIAATASKQHRPHSSNLLPVRATSQSTAEQTNGRYRSPVKRGKQGPSEMRVVASK